MSSDNEEVPDTATIKKIAEKVRVRREQLDLDQDLARYGGPSRSTVSILENKGTWPLRQRTRASWSKVLGWESDAFERMLQGEDPVEVGGGAPKPNDRLSELVTRLRELVDEAERLLEEREK